MCSKLQAGAPFGVLDLLDVILRLRRRIARKRLALSALVSPLIIGRLSCTLGIDARPLYR